MFDTIVGQLARKDKPKQQQQKQTNHYCYYKNGSTLTALFIGIKVSFFFQELSLLRYGEGGGSQL